MNPRFISCSRPRVAVPLSVFALLLLVIALFPQRAAWAAAGEVPVVFSGKIAPEVWRKLQAGEISDVLVLFEDAAIEAEVGAQSSLRALQKEDLAITQLRADRYRTLKTRVLAALPVADVELRRDFRQLPMVYLHLRNQAALLRLLARSEVAAVYENTVLYAQLAETLPLIGQPQVNQVMGRNGSGASMVILDTGADYTRAEFGSCTAPGVPAGCRVVAAFDAAPEDNARDANGHGTWVAGTATAVAPGAGIIAIDVFDGTSASSVDVIEGIDWSIANRAAYNIVAINMSLGDGAKYTSSCSSKLSNPYRQPIINARSAGILSIVSSGNNGYSDGISNPACTPEAVSVGAVYDANVGARTWTAPEPDCTDSTSAADKVACFSNSASFLTLLAPGALTTVTGVTAAGTSLSSPVVTGAVALLAQGFPGDTAVSRLGRLTANGKPVADTRNSLVKPRVDVLAAQGTPVNDAFAAAMLISGVSGSVTGWNLNATQESGEPVHAAISGGQSVWWQWTADVSGTLSLDTHGSGIDTLLAVYTGSSVSTLLAASANDNDGSAGNASGLGLEVTAGTVYRIAVDGKAAASGALTLAWSVLQAQTISFAPLDDMVVNSAFNLSATTSSGLSVSFSSQTPATCMVAGNVVSLVATGTCTLAASQSGGAGYGAAPSVTQSFSVTPLGQTISFPLIASQTLDTAPFTVAATASSGLPVNIASLTPAVCSVSSHTVSLLAAGLCTLEASQAGDTQTSAALAVMQTFSVASASGSGGNDGDVPLPPWALVLLGGGLLAVMRKRLA